MSTFFNPTTPFCQNAYIKVKHDLYTWSYDAWPDGEPIFGPLDKPGLYGGFLPNGYNASCYLKDINANFDLSGKSIRPRRYGTDTGQNTLSAWYFYLSSRLKCDQGCYSSYCSVDINNLNQSQINSLKDVGNWNCGTWTAILISPRHVISTKHWTPSVVTNVTLNFLLKNNVIIQKNATRVYNSSGLDLLSGDHIVWRFDDDLGLSDEISNNLIEVYDHYIDMSVSNFDKLNSIFNNVNYDLRPILFRVDGGDRVVRAFSTYSQSNFECNIIELYNRLNDGFQIGGAGVYTGDSGSPQFVYDKTSGKTIFIGLASGGNNGHVLGNNLNILSEELNRYGYFLYPVNLDSANFANINDIRLYNPNGGSVSSNANLLVPSSKIEISRSSIYGSAIKNSSYQNDKILNLSSTVSLRPCDFDYAQDENDIGNISAWNPCRVNWSNYSNNVMQYGVSALSGKISYSLDIPNSGDYVFCIKISKRYGFSIANSLSLSIKSYASYVPEDSEAMRLYVRGISDDVINEHLDNISLELRQDAEDSVWVCAEFTALIPGRHEFSIKINSEDVSLLPLVNPNLYIEAVVACDKYLFNESNLLLVNGTYMKIGVLKVFKVISMPDEHVLSPVSFIQSLSKYDGKILIKVLYKKSEQNLLDYADTFRWFAFNLSDFANNQRKVYGIINNSLSINEEDLSNLLFLVIEDFYTDVWSFNYSHDVLSTSGKTFIINDNNALDILPYNMCLELYSKDEKVKQYGVQLDAINLRALNHVVIYPAEGRNILFDDLTDSDIRVVDKENYILETDLYGNYYKLSLPERHQAFIIDNSGSMSWSDFDKTRFELVNSTIDNFFNLYPGDVSYSITSIKGSPLIVNWFGGIESDIEDTSDPDSVRRAFLKNKFTNFKGIHIVRKIGEIPASPTDGEIVFNGYDEVFYDTNLVENQDYYYALYPMDTNNRLGVPSIVKSRTRSNNTVRGIKSLSAKEYIGSGLRRDESSFFIAHMNEGSGNRIYDFSGNRINFSIQDNLLNSVVWIDSSEAPPTSANSNISKGYGLRFSGSNSLLSWNGNKAAVFKGFNFSCWLFQFSNISYNGLVLFRIVSVAGQMEIRYFGQSLAIYLNGIRVGSLGATLANDQWSHISFDVDESFSILNTYINGLLSNAVNISVFSNVLSSILNSNITSIYIGGDGAQAGFSGKLTEVSLFTRSYSAEEIEYNALNIPADNGDRLIVLKWFTVLSNENHKIIIKYKPEGGPLRLLDQDIAGPANYGQYQGDASISVPPGTPPGQIPQSDLRARLCFGDDIGSVGELDGATIYDSSIDGVLDEWSFIDSFSPEISERERFSVNIRGYRHFFRIFRIDSNNLPSPPDDSGLVEYSCKDFSESVLPNLTVDPVSNLSISAGNKKIRLDWDAAQGENIDSVLVYYSKNPIPSNFLDKSVSSGSSIYTVFAGTSRDSTFTHYYGRVGDSQRRSVSDPAFGGISAGNYEVMEDLENNITAYYAVVSRDRYGRFGSPVFISGIPSESNNDSNVGPESIIAARAYAVDYNSISIKWINPVSRNRFFDIVGWLDDDVILYFRITDIYGRRLDEQEDFELAFRFNDALNGLLAAPEARGFNDAEIDGAVTLFDVDNRVPIVNNISFSEVVSYSQTKLPNGWVKVVVTTNNSALTDKNYVEYAYTTASMKIVRNNNFGADPQFSFTTQPIRIWLKHPLELSVVANELVVYSPQRYSPQSIGDSAISICEYGDTSGNSNIGGEFNLYGAFAGRKRPYAFEVRAKYRGKPLPSGTSARITVFEDLEGTVSLDPRDGVLEYNIPYGFQGVIGVNPELGTPRSRLGLPGTYNAQQRESYPESNVIIPVNSSVAFINNATNTESVGFAQLRVPATKGFGRVFASLSVGEYKKAVGFYICFNSSLYVKLSVSSPLPNGEDLARQYAYVYTIDPDRFLLTNAGTSGDFVLEDFARPVPDGTQVIWRLDKLRNGKDRPFYSLTQTGAGGGVVDRTVDGVSSGVIFGPASNVASTIIGSGENVYLIPEEYIISANVNYAGVNATAAAPVCIYPEEITPDQVLPSINQSSFYFAGKSFGSVDGNIQYLYADGSDFATLEIIRDPRIILSEFDDPRINDIRIFCKCYNADGTNSGIDNASIAILPENQLIEIKSIKLPDCYSNGISSYYKGKIEILHGNDLETYVDADGLLQVRSSESSLDAVVINTESQNRSTIAVRSNSFIPFKWSNSISGIFSADPGPNSPAFCSESFWQQRQIGAAQPHAYLNASTSIILNNSERSIFSDGGKAVGNPPKMFNFIEPLYLKLAYIVKDGVKIFDNYVDINGTSIYEIVFVAKFAGRPVPDGTPVKFYKCGSNAISLEDTIGYTTVREEIGFWSYGPTGEFETSSASFVSVFLSPLESTYPIFAYILAEINYNKNGNIFRQKLAGVDLSYTGGIGNGGESGGGGALQFTGGGVGGGNTNQPPGGDSESNLNPYPEIVSEVENRIARLFINNAITNNCYIFDSNATQENLKWRQIANMNLRRAMHNSEYVNSKLYAICGLSGYGTDPNSVNSTLTLTNSVESWSLAENRWVGVSSSAVSRFAAASCNDGSRYIYLIGGFEARIGNVEIGGESVSRLVPKISRRLERYDTLTDTWISLCPMPVIDSSGNVITVNVEVNFEEEFNSSFTEYGVAFGSAVLLSNYIIVLGGSIKSDYNLSTINYNDKILVYSINENIWRVTESFTDPLFTEFKRINPVCFVESEKIVIFGGSSSVIETEEAELNGNEFILENIKKFAVQNCFDISWQNLIGENPNTSSLRRADFRFVQLPKARDQVSYAKLNNGKRYIFGGRVFGDENKPGTNATRYAEQIVLNQNQRYEVSAQTKPSFGRSSSGYSNDGQSLVYITGGITTNQSPGFVRLEISAYGEQTEQVNVEQLSVLERPDAVVRLDGYSGVDLKIEAYDDEGDLISGNLLVELSGIISYGDGSEEAGNSGTLGSAGGSRTFNKRRKRKGTKIYPIIISPRELNCVNGVGYARLEGRSEDVLKSLEEIQEILNLDLEADQRLLGDFAGLDLKQGVVRFPYRISVVGKVIDDLYYGGTTYVSSDSESDVSEELFIPESEAEDVIADAGQFGEAVIIPPMLPAFAGTRAPAVLRDLGPVLTCSASGVIGPVGDIDLFKFVPQKTGSYYITVEQKNFSTLKAKIKLFNGNFLPYYIGETGTNEISFNIDGEPLGGISSEVDFIEGFTYYIQVDTYASSSDPETSFVGSYKLRFTIPIEAVQGNGDNNQGGNLLNEGTLLTGGNKSTDIVDYLSPEILENFDISVFWFNKLRSFYEIYFSALLNNGAFSQQAVDVAVANVSGLISCPFRCQSCRRQASADVESPTCFVLSQGSELIVCSGSDNLECKFYYGNGEVFTGQSSSSSSAVNLIESSSTSSSNLLNIPNPGSNEITIEDIKFDSVNILASSVFGSENSAPLTEGDSPIIQYYSDIDWIPSIESKIFIGRNASEQAKLYVRKLSQSIPFGSSPIYDGIEKSSALIKSNFDSDVILKNILLISDNDENTSGNSPLQNIESINDIDGEKRVKLNAVNINTFYPVTISALSSRVNLAGISPIIYATGGQSFALFSNDFLAEVLQFGFAGSAGSAGAGSVVIEFDFIEQLIVNEILPIIEVGTEDSITYTASYSANGVNFVDVGLFSDPGVPLGVNSTLRYLRVTFKNLIQFSNQKANINTPSLSKIRGMSINVAPTDESFIFSKLINLQSIPQQCIVHIDWDGGEGAQVSAGVSLIDSGDWKDYEKDSQPIIPGSGKVIIPIRSKDLFGLIKENLEQKSPYIYLLPHGGVGINSDLVIYDSSSDIAVSPEYYDIDRDAGIVRFSSPQFNNSYYIEVIESKKIKVGIRAKFGASRDPIYVNKFGFMINLSDNLSQLTINQPPVAVNVRISPINIYPYTAITAMYQYADVEGDVEDIEKRIIKWYKNGLEITELLNVISFNDLHNPSDPTYAFFFTENYAIIEANTGFNAEVQAALASERLFSAGDQIYYTIQVHDGNQYSSIFRSRTISVSDYPSIPASLTLRSRYALDGLPDPDISGQIGAPAAGQITSEVSNRTFLFLDFELFSQNVYNVTTVEWWVIDNNNIERLFKSGLISDLNLPLQQLTPVEKQPVTNFEAVKIGHQIYAKLRIPANAAPGITQPVEVRSNTVTVVNVKPLCTSVRMDIANSPTSSAIFMTVRYSVFDPDIIQRDNIAGSTLLQYIEGSIIRLYQKIVGDDDFTLDTRFVSDIDLREQTINLRDYFEPGTQIFVECLPFDGQEYGVARKSTDFNEDPFTIPPII